MTTLAKSFFIAGCLLASLSGVQAKETVERLRQSLVRVNVFAQNPDFREPWQPGGTGQGSGSGFLISGNRIMTNAHVVSNARILILEKDGDPRRYRASVDYIAHDCDLALLTVEDETFFEGMTALEFGDLPSLHSTVTAYGFPMGGRRMSVTRGVVSRIEFRQYSHSALDAHLAIQIDAAINPGNSGGPVIQDGKVVGVAFQGIAGQGAQNIGYMIPMPVVSRFLQDIEDGTYDGYVELGIMYLHLFNPSIRQKLGVLGNELGVVTTKVHDCGSAAGKLLAGDVLMGIDDHPIFANGTIALDGDTVQLEEIVERKFHGDIVTFDILREGKKMKVEVTLQGAWPYRIMANLFDQQPRYVMFAGMVMQPLSRNFIQAHGIDDLDILYFYNFFVSDEIYLERPEIVVLSMVLPDEINAKIRYFAPAIINEVNGQKIKKLRDVADALQMPVRNHVIRLEGRGRPIVIDASQAMAAQNRIMERYQIFRDHYLGDAEAAQ